MHFFVVSVLPEIFDSFASVGVFGRALTTNIVQFTRIALRDHSTNRYRSVDDYPYGGGDGMVMTPEPMVASLRAADALAATAGGVVPKKILLGAHGRPFTQRDAERYAAHGALTLLCGRYEGIDERVTHYVDEEVSVGDYVLMGGESAAMCIMEAVSRLVPGVLGNTNSTSNESHNDGLLEYPQYTRPVEFEGLQAPDVLLSGNHKDVATFRLQAAIERTARLRPKLLQRLLDTHTSDDELVREIKKVWKRETPR